MDKIFKVGDVVICNTTIFNLEAGREYTIYMVGYFDGIFLVNHDNQTGGYGYSWFDLKPTDSQLFAENIISRLEADIAAFEELERELNQTNK